MRILTVVFLYFFTTIVLLGQAPGISVQTGLTVSTSKDKNITKASELHYGWMVGADARLLEGDLYFIIGEQYHQVGLNSSSTPDFFKKKDWKMLKGRCGLGFNVFRINEKISFRSKILGSINFLLDAPRKALNIPNYSTLNDSFLGAVTGLGVSIGAIDIDLDYEYGIINAYNKQPNSTFDTWTLMAGFHF